MFDQYINPIKCFVLCVVLSACSSGPTDRDANRYDEPGADRPLVDAKYSLAADRQAVQELRKDIPETKKQENDELALMLQMVGGENQQPSRVREKWSGLTRKRRQSFDSDLKKERERFGKDERSKRDDFLKSQQQARDNFKKNKSTREQSQDFYREQADTRREFFQTQRERRDDFESSVRERRRDFDDYMREKNSQFNDEMKNYTKKWEDIRKEKQLQQKQQQQQRSAPSSSGVGGGYSSDLDELTREIEAARSSPGVRLEAGENE